MPTRSRPRVVAIGVDAAEPTLVRALAERGDMPTLRALFAAGVSGPVASPAAIGSIAVWPTFVSGRSLWDHEKHSIWSWDPARMRVERETFASLQPFWRGGRPANRRIGVVDVPFTTPPTPLEGFEVTEWGAHDFLLGAMHTCPPSLAARVRAVAGVHPIKGSIDASAEARIPDDLLELCVDGVQRRGRLVEYLIREESPELFLTVFSETHRAGHLLWHTVPTALGGSASTASPARGLIELFREVDRQLGRIVALAGDDATVMVFSLHGMCTTRGVPRVLERLLPAVGLATPTAERLRAKVKRHVPAPIKRLYHRAVPTAVRWDLARLDLIPRYDWSRTKAFAMPTDQHGWIRVNLEGREAEGIVEPTAYDTFCGELERLLGDLRMTDGMPVVRDVARTASVSPRGIPEHLPDLVVHWTPAANLRPLTLRDPAIACELGAPRLTGQHAPDGFWVFRSPRPGPAGGRPIAAEAIGRMLLDHLATA